MKAAPRKRLSKTATLVALFWALAVPQIAFACPVCAQGESGGVGRKIALGLFIFLPFVVVGSVLFILRASIRREEKLVVRSQA